jgi:hypothetical protein
MSGIIESYVPAWKFCVGTGAGGRGGASAENQPATERVAHCGIRCTAVEALRSLLMTVFSLSGAAAAGGSGICTIGNGAAAPAT